MEGHILSEFLPEHKHLLYTYDMGDNWEHEIKLVKVIEEYDKQSPFLLEVPTRFAEEMIWLSKSQSELKEMFAGI